MKLVADLGVRVRSASGTVDVTIAWSRMSAAR